MKISFSDDSGLLPFGKPNGSSPESDFVKLIFVSLH